MVSRHLIFVLAVCDSYVIYVVLLCCFMQEEEEYFSATDTTRLAEIQKEREDAKQAKMQKHRLMDEHLGLLNVTKCWE